MKPVLALTALLCFLATAPVHAAVSPKVDAAIKALAKIGEDAAKFKDFCRITKELATVGEDAARSEALDKQLEELLRTIGYDVYMAWDLGSDLDPNSEDGQAFDSALDAIEDKCGE